jgi:chromosome segregation ATPase
VNRFIIGPNLNEHSLKAELSIGTVTGKEALEVLNLLFDAVRPVPMSNSAILPAEYADYDDVQSERDELRDENEKLESQRDDAESERDDANDEADALEEENARLKATINELQSALNETVRRYEPSYTTSFDEIRVGQENLSAVLEAKANVEYANARLTDAESVIYKRLAELRRKEEVAPYHQSVATEAAENFKKITTTKDK